MADFKFYLNMYLNINLVLTIVFIIGIGCTSNNIYSQTDAIIQSQVENYLDNKDISEEEIRAKLVEKGYNPDNITSDQLPQYQSVLEEIIAEIEEERSEYKEDIVEAVEEEVNNTVSENSQEIIDRVEDGASLEEAISEESAENLQETKSTPNIYGHQIFRDSELSLYRAADDISAPDDYILSTGDKIKISIFGASQADFEYIIDKSGEINPVNVGKVFLKGLTIAEAKKLLRQRFSRAYRFLPEQFSMVLTTARTVTVNIFGEVVQPGSYTISAINTGLNALMAAGGPKANGSVRNIKLIKGNGQTKMLDVYEYLNDPKVQFDFPIDDQDIIFVPLAGEIVEILGAVRRPMKYEIKSNETIKDLIGYSGGLNSNAYADFLQVSRQGNNEREIIDVSAKSSFRLSDGDIITVREGSDELKRYVKAMGEISFPGDYAHKEGMTLQDLIDKARLTEYTRPDIIFIFRHKLDGTISLEKIDATVTSPRSVKLNVRDQVKFTSLKAYVDQTKEVTIVGAVREPDSFIFNPEDKIHISDLILLSGGLSLNASPRAILKRKNLENTEEVAYIEVNVFEAISAPKSDADLILKEGDELIVYNNERYNNLGTVSIVGQVRNPDTIAYDASLSLNDLILLSGGLKENANSTAIIKRMALDNDKEVEYIKVNLEKNLGSTDLQRGDEIRVYDKSTYMDRYSVQIFGEVKNPGSYDYDETLTIEDMVYMSGGLTLQAATNRVEIYRVDFSENNPTQILVKEVNLNRKGALISDTNIDLEPFDIIVIRPIPDFELQQVVYINGEVKYPGPYILSKKDEKIGDIVKRAGGLQYDAFPGGATLLRKRGDKAGNIFINLKDVLKPGNSHENIVMREGDVLFIPKKENIVSIITRGTRAQKEYADSLLVENKIQLAYQGSKSARWYINNFAGGFDRKVDRKSVRVIEPNGRVRGTKRYLGFIYDYPTVIEGSTIAVDYKVQKPEKERKSIDWTKTITDTMAIVSSAVTIMVLATQLNKKNE